MRTISTAGIVLAALPSIYAISLGDFKPYLTNLPAACQVIYSSQVLGCTSTDFTSGQGCSTSCIAGLQALVPPIQLTCSGANLPDGSNVLSSFLSGNGVYSLCPNAPAAASTSSTISTTSTTSVASTTSTTAAASTTAAPSTVAATTSDAMTTSSILSTTQAFPVVATTSSSSSSSIADTTSSTSSQVLSTTSASAAAASSSTSPSPIFIYSSSSTAANPNSLASTTTSSQSSKQTPGNNSGGGSPFDSTSMASSFTTDLFLPLLSALLAALIV